MADYRDRNNPNRRPHRADRFIDHDRRTGTIRPDASAYSASNARYRTGGEARARQKGAGTPHIDGRERTRTRTRTAGTGLPRSGFASREARRGGRRAWPIAAGALVALALAVGIIGWQMNAPIAVAVNGQDVELSEKRTVQAAFEAAGSPAQPGDLYDIEGALLQEGGGQPYQATVNGAPASADTELSADDTVEFADGADEEEPSETKENQPIEPGVVEEGHGPVHMVTEPGAPGVGTVKVGSVSGKQAVVEVVTPAVDRAYRRYFPDTGGDKVIALTFDDGPWQDTTSQILDVLRDNDAKATFFTVGTRIGEGDGTALVQREVAEGHQVCTHTWSHASGSGQGVNLGYMTPDEQRAEVSQGMQAIADATGQPASTVMRAPGGNFPIEVWRNVDGLITADIGWDIDTTDWKKPGVSRIAAALSQATPGDIILMHDGGGDRSQTVEALRIALPMLKQEGFRFITIDEMLQYPPKEDY